jgi:glycosyltransferase involved in cell wall biosynthesis
MTGSLVVYVVPTLQHGGAESQLAMLAGGLAAEGRACHVFALDASGPIRGRLERAGVVVHDCGARLAGHRSTFRVLALALAMVRLIAFCRRKRPRVLHAFLPLANFLGAVVGRIAGVPRIVTSRRGLGTHQDRAPYWKPFERLANRLSDEIVANSAAVAADAAVRDRLPPGRVRVVPNGLDLSRFLDAGPRREAMRRALALGDADIAIANVANLIPYKGQMELIEALARVRVAHAGVRLFLIGEDRGFGPDLMRLAEARGVADRVVFLGRRDDVAELLAAMDLFVLASHEEGSSNALLEAMAAGVPVVATAVGGCTEALDGGALGPLVPARDPAALAVAIATVLDEPDVARARAAAARKHVEERYSVSAMIAAYRALYDA